VNSWPRRLRVAVIEPEAAVRRLLAERARRAGWELHPLPEAPPIEELIAARLDALLLDLDVAGSERWAYLDRLCALLPELGVLVATSAPTVAERVRGLRIGADDWIAKPYGAEEAMARIEAIARRRLRTRERLRGEPLRFDRLELRNEQLQGFVDGRSLGLTPREFEVLLVLVHQAGNVVRREELYRQVWDRAMPDHDRAVDAFVHKVRRKLTRLAPEREWIHTHARVGYRFESFVGAA
jgi:DNA-binding response OmpR family regulator